MCRCDWDWSLVAYHRRRALVVTVLFLSSQGLHIVSFSLSCGCGSISLVTRPPHGISLLFLLLFLSSQELDVSFSYSCCYDSIFARSSQGLYMVSFSRSCRYRFIHPVARGPTISFSIPALPFYSSRHKISIRSRSLAPANPTFCFFAVLSSAGDVVSQEDLRHARTSLIAAVESVEHVHEVYLNNNEVRGMTVGRGRTNTGL